MQGNRLGGHFERRINEDDPDWSNGLEKGKQGSGGDAPERVSNDDVVSAIATSGGRKEGPELFRQCDDGIIRTTPGISVPKQIRSRDEVTYIG